ncbi:hypothetical protein BDW02DRAFT_574184 [Decorospora gaudefroyi]|uniref:Uncharacterized protein n=1 Tax=Decorospora gaudefroyi TaxID=184978 RepID=A0A6A5K432_9PLEO|nr:hypothetical protein BDW02DRAFT_574184 [Decorospora gaudefroyi]
MSALASASFPALLLLLASAVVAQDTTPSVVTDISISPTPTTEIILTIQTSTPDPWSCYQDCIQPPCPQCSTDSTMSIPPVPLPTPISVITDPLLSTLTGSADGTMSIPPVPLPSVISVITDPLLSTVTGIMSILPEKTTLSTGLMSIPAGETPISTGSLDTPTATTSSGLPELPTGAAVPVAKRDGLPLVVAMAGLLAFH